MAAARQVAFCTLLTSDAYLPGAMVLAHSLRDNATKKGLAVLVTLDSLSASTLEELKTIYDHIIPVDRITNKSPQNLYLMNRPDLVSTFTKIALWRQTQFDHIVYIDADVVTLRAPDELFDSSPNFAAVPDIGWPDCFNSGVLSLKPNMGDYYALLALAQRGISFDGADQGLLNMHFRDWQRLSFTYNCTPSGNYQYLPAYRHFQSQINMVHYIGNEKPWLIGREHKGASGVYEELLGRWWAVYDKHYMTLSTVYISGQAPKQSRTVQQYVKGETSSTDYGFSSTDLAEDIQQGEVKPTPTAQQRRFSTDWDPIHNPPPAHSRPEAANFPTEIYEMSEDRKLFHAPRYPEPPKDMYYQVPSAPTADERPKPIFPWETTAPKPTRVFADDAPPPAASSEGTPSVTTDDDDDTQTETMSPATPTIHSSNTEPFAAYTRTNAWDDVPEIERYISQLPQNRRAKIQVLLNNATPTSSFHQRNVSGDEPMLSPGIEDPSQQRRPSMRLTDFPSEIERPSLPVTPAPVRRPSFWGLERDAAGDLPGAEGVPDQSAWDPVAKLAELQRRQSEMLAEGPASPGRFIPDREFPGSSSAPLTEREEEEKEKGLPTAGSTQGAMPTAFRTFDFNRGSVSRNREISGESVAEAQTES